METSDMVGLIPILPPGTEARNTLVQGLDFDAETAIGVDDKAYLDEPLLERIRGEAKNVKFAPSSVWGNIYVIIVTKLSMLKFIDNHFKELGFIFNMPERTTPVEVYFHYEMSALWMWTEMIFLTKSRCDFGNCFYLKYKDIIESLWLKYPDIMGILASDMDLHVPGNKFFDLQKVSKGT